MRIYSYSTEPIINAPPPQSSRAFPGRCGWTAGIVSGGQLRGQTPIPIESIPTNQYSNRLHRCRDDNRQVHSAVRSLRADPPARHAQCRSR